MTSNRNVDLLPTNVVTQSNQIIESKYSLNLLEQRLILAMISMINPEDEDFREYNIRISDLSKLLGIKSNNFHSEVKKVTKDILGKTLQIERDKKTLQVNWISSAEYNNNSGFVSLTFDPKLKPYLLQLKQNFTSTALSIVSHFKSFYTIKIYLLLKQYEKIAKRVITVDNLRSYFPNYQVYGDLKRRVILSAQKEINSKSDINFTFVEKKLGRKIFELVFHIKKQAYLEELPLQLPPIKKKKNINRDLDDNNIGFAKKLSKLYGIESSVSEELVREVFERNPEEDFDKILEYIDSTLSGGKVRSVAGFVVSCIKNSYYSYVPQKYDNDKKKAFNSYLSQIVKNKFFKMSKKEKEFYIQKVSEEDGFFAGEYKSKGFSDINVLSLFIVNLKAIMFNESEIEDLRSKFFSKVI